MSIWVTLEMKVKEGEFEKLSDFLKENISRVRGFDGALQVCLYHNSKQNAFLIHEQWLSEQHHQAYIQFIQENGVMDALVSFMEKPPVVTYYEKLMM